MVDLAPLGLDEILLSLENGNWGSDQTKVIFRSALVMIAIILTGFVVNLRLFTLLGRGRRISCCGAIPAKERDSR